MHVNDIKPSLGRVYCDFDLPITGSGQFKDLNGDVVQLITYVEWYAFTPTHYLKYNGYTVSVADKDNIPNAELALCLRINQTKDN